MTSPTFSMNQSISERHEQQSIDLKELKLLFKLLLNQKDIKKLLL